MPYQSEIFDRMKQEELYSFVSYKILEEAGKKYIGGTFRGNQWIFFKNPIEYEILNTIYKDALRFSDLLEIFVGLQTSNDNLFVIEVERTEADFYFGKNKISDTLWQVEKRWFKKLLKGRDVQQYGPLETTAYVFFPYAITNGTARFVDLDELNKYPFTYQFVKQQADVFKARESGKAGRMNNWYGYIYPKNLVKFEQLKLSSMEICTTRPNVTLNYNNLYHNTKVYSWVKKSATPESYEYLLAIANSSLMWWFLKNTGDSLQGDARRLKSNYLNPFPIPDSYYPNEEATIADLVRYVLFLKDPATKTVKESLSNGAIAQFFIQVLDSCVLELYFREHMREREINVLEFVKVEVRTPNDLESIQSCINTVFSLWQQSKSEVRNRLLLMQVRSPEVIQLIKNP